MYLRNPFDLTFSIKIYNSLIIHGRAKNTERVNKYNKMIQKAFFVVVAEYSSYRTTEFKVQALPGLVPKEGQLLGQCLDAQIVGTSSASVPDLRSAPQTTHNPLLPAHNGHKILT